MYVHQKVTMNIPTGGSAPRNLAAIIRKPKVQKREYNVKSFKEVYANAKNNTEYDED